jgi:hypothetical protein
MQQLITQYEENVKIEEKGFEFLACLYISLSLIERIASFVVACKLDYSINGDLLSFGE